MIPPRTRAAARDLTLLVALAAALWGTDAPLRLPLAKDVAAPTIVLGEHAVLVLVLLPVLPRAWRAFRRLDARGRMAVVGVGAGASAVATTLFTISFRFGDPVTPVVIQKLQPVIAIAGAALLLGERIRPVFAFFAVPALVGVWMLAFPNPFRVTVARLDVVLLAFGAAVLWAAGTVLGRMVSDRLAPVELTALRFGFGLPTALVIVVVTGSPLWVPDVASSGSVVALALVPGLLAMELYYVGLRRTPASRATLAELAYPLTAAVLGVVIFHAQLSATQWIGAAVVVVAVTALGWHEARAGRPAVRTEPTAGPATTGPTRSRWGAAGPGRTPCR